MQTDTPQDTPHEMPAMASPKTLPANPIQQLVKEWEPAVGMDDVAALEQALDEAVKHIGTLLKMMPGRSHRHVIKARRFLAQFR